MITHLNVIIEKSLSHSLYFKDTFKLLECDLPRLHQNLTYTLLSGK